MDFKKLKQRLSSRLRLRCGFLEVTSSDADLVTDSEKDMLEQVAEGKDPFAIVRRKMDKAEEGETLHFSSLGRKESEYASSFLRNQARKEAQYEVDPDFGKKNPELHRFLLRIHKLLEETEDLYNEMPDDPMVMHPAPPLDPVLYKFQSVYRSLKEGMDQLRDHYKRYGNVHDKWVKLLQQRFKDFIPVYNRLQESDSEQESEKAEVESPEDSESN